MANEAEEAFGRGEVDRAAAKYVEACGAAERALADARKALEITALQAELGHTLAAYEAMQEKWAAVLRQHGGQRWAAAQESAQRSSTEMQRAEEGAFARARDHAREALRLLEGAIDDARTLQKLLEEARRLLNAAHIDVTTAPSYVSRTDREASQAALSKVTKALALNPTDVEARRMHDALQQWTSVPPWQATFPLTADQARQVQEQAAIFFCLPVHAVITLGRQETLTLTLIPPGEFDMRMPDGTRHQVAVPAPMYVGTTEVTWAQWHAVMEEDSSKPHRDAQRPVYGVSMVRCEEFCRRANHLLTENPPSPTIRLRIPTETEWEYACRAGSAHMFYFGDEPADLRNAGWYLGNSPEPPQPARVKQKAGNAWGLFDMHGNVAEWCTDVFVSAPQLDAVPGDSDQRRPVRGGSFAVAASECGCESRSPEYRATGGPRVGLRVVADWVRFGH